MFYIKDMQSIRLAGFLGLCVYAAVYISAACIYCTLVRGIQTPMGVPPLVFSRLQMLHRVPWNWVNNRGAILRGRHFSRSCDAEFISCEKFLEKKKKKKNMIE